MSVPQILDALREKHGKETQFTGYPRVWFFDPKDRPAPPPIAFKELMHCNVRWDSVGGFDSMLSDYDAAMRSREADYIKKKINPGCGKVLQVQFSPTDNPNLTNSLDVILIDNAAYYQALGTTRNYLISQKGAHAKQEAEKAKARGLPSL